MDMEADSAMDERREHDVYDQIRRWCVLVVRMWRLLLVIFISFVSFSLFYDIENAFLMSLVTCPEPFPDGSGRCPKGAFFEEGRCKAWPPSSRDWSFSMHCASKHQVLNAGRQMLANVHSMMHIGRLFAIIVLGHLVDTWGRKQVLLLGLSAFCMKSGMQWLATRLADQSALQSNIIIAAILIANMLDNKLPAANAMTADLAGSDEAGRTVAFTILWFVVYASVAVGFGVGFLILRMNLPSYDNVWLICTSASALFLPVFAIILKNPAITGQAVNERSAPNSGSDSQTECFAGFCMKVRATCSVYSKHLRDPILRQLLLLFGFLEFTRPADHLEKQLLLGPLGYSQSTASLSAVVHPATAALGNAFSGILSGSLGLFCTLGASTTLHSLSMILVGLCVPVQAARQELFWSGNLIGSLSQGMLRPIMHSVLSVRVAQDEQGRLFALLMVMEQIGSLVGVQVFAKRLYNAEWTGWQAGAAFFLAALLGLFGVLWTFLIWRILRYKDITGNTSSDSDESSVSS